MTHKQHKSTEKYDDICSLKRRLLDYVNGETAHGLEGSPAKAHVLGEYVDMIKDLAEAEKYCQEACYYESVVSAMEESDMPYGRMGYRPDRDSEGRYTSNGSGMNTRSGYIPDFMNDRMRNPNDQDPDYDEHYGREFNNFRKARRHYTSSHSEEDKEEMKNHASRHLRDSIASINEIWESADPDMKRRMKTDLTKLVNDMTV